MTLVCRHAGPYPQSFLRGAITIGNFDGVHVGHRALLNEVRRMAESIGGPSIVFTFDPSPAELLYPGFAPPALTWLDRRLDLLEQARVDGVIIYPTEPSLLSLTASEFFQKIVVDGLQARGIVEGPNFRFGKNREGDTRFLNRVCLERQMQFTVVEPIRSDEGEAISSSSIRTAITAGDLAKANRWLVEPYRITGTVVEGAKRGRQLGFPTANLERIPNLIPAPGVYSGEIECQGVTYRCAINVGPNPTFGETRSKVEIHIIDFQGDLYGSQLEVTLIRRLRDVRSFHSREQLVQQLHRDIEQARQLETSS